MSATATDTHRPEPREVARQLEHAQLPASEDREHVRGYGVIGVPFSSGHLLAMRRFPASSVGPGYTSVWHRSPEGRWTFYQDQDPLVSCPRAFGPSIDESVRTDIGLDWTGPRAFAMSIDEPVRLRWHLELETTPVARALNALVSAAPAPVRRSRPFAAIAGRVAGVTLGAGRLRLMGEAPSGQDFHADVQEVWLLDESSATIDEQDLGDPAPLDEQIRLGDFWIPQRGMFAFGDGLFDPYDPTRHLQVACRAAAAA